MSNLFVFIGVLILALTLWELKREETDTIIILDWVWWFDVSRANLPLIYWIIIIFQFVMGVGLIAKGFGLIDWSFDV